MQFKTLTLLAIASISSQAAPTAEPAPNLELRADNCPKNGLAYLYPQSDFKGQAVKIQIYAQQPTFCQIFDNPITVASSADSNVDVFLFKDNTCDKNKKFDGIVVQPGFNQTISNSGPYGSFIAAYQG